MSEEVTLTRDRAVEALWGHLRLVVIDLETCVDPDGGLRIVSIGLVTCRGGRVMGRWSTTVNPGVPIDRSSTKVHGIRDEDVLQAPTFTDIADTVAAGLAERPGEQLVLVAHNIGFDIPILRNELARTNQDLPNVAVLDTMGKLPGFVGVTVANRKLSTLLTTLGIVNTNPHDALGDAVATAQAVCELLARAGEAGHTDIAGILTAVEAPTAHDVARTPLVGALGSAPEAPTLPDAHLEAHGKVLPKRVSKKAAGQWVSELSLCADLRCSHAAARVREAEASPDVLFDLITLALERSAQKSDWPGVATLLDAAAPVLERIAETMTLRQRRFRAIVAVRQWRTLTAQAERCDKDLCPACRDGMPCGIDTWLYHAAGSAVGDWNKGVLKGFLHFTGQAGRDGAGVWPKWVAAGDGALADAALWRCYEWWRDNGHATSAALLAQAAWNAGCRHPRLTDAYMNALAVSARPADIQAALACADDTLRSATRLGPPEHWRALEARRARLAGLLARGQVRLSNKLDADGNPIPIRRHHPTNPRRTRPTRFLRSNTAPVGE